MNNNPLFSDTKKLRYGKGIRLEKGRNIAIPEWPLKKGFADYALFIGLELVAIIEAKRKSKNILSDIEQAENYARLVVQHDDEIFVKLMVIILYRSYLLLMVGLF
ncbi:type I restriction endonuclease [Bacillus timonensis]|nr:type I restriction endonuclease [Bacillus timonensis]